MERSAEADHRRPAGVRARDLDGVLHRLRAGAEEDRLLGSVAWRQLAQPLSELDVRLVHHHLEGRVRDAVELLAHRGHDVRVVVADVHDANAADEVDVAAALGIPDL